MASTISKSVTPVRASPERIAHGIAALPAVARQQGRVHSEHAFAREREERLADDLGPAHDEDQLRIELADRLERLGCVDVRRLDERRAEAFRDARRTRIAPSGSGRSAPEG